jgi:tetratricopeptide (TPR) repeat protein/O-antigen ligase
MKNSFQSVNWRYLFRESVLILLLSYFLLLASTHNGLVNMHIFSITTALFALIAILWIVFGQQVSIGKELIILLFLGIMAVAAAFSIDPRRSFTEVWLLGAALFLFLLTSELVSRGWEADLWIKALLIVGSIVMVLTWREAIAWYRQWLDFTGKIWPEIFYRLPAPNFLAVFLNILLMVAAASLLFTRSKAAKILLGLWILSAVGLIYLTSSRGGWLGTAAGLGSLVLLSAFAFPERRKAVFQWLREHRLFSILLLVGVLAVLLAFGWVFYKQSQMPTHAAVGESRSFLWNPAWQAFLNSPVIGKGPYTYISFYLQHESTPPSPMYLYAHSIYIDLLSGSGVLGLVAFLLMIAGLALGLFRRFKISSGQERGAVIAALAALAAFLVHGLVDSVHHTIPTVAWLLAVVLGLGIGKPEPAKPRRVSLSLALVLGLVLAGGLNLWAEMPLHVGVIAGNSGLWTEARTSFQQAIGRDPDLAIAYQQLGMAESQLAERGNAEELQNAIQHFKQAIVIDPYWGLNHANLGVLYRAQGDLPRSRDALAQAVALSPKSALFQLNLGITCEMMEDFPRASAAYETAVQLQPLWAEAPFWRATPFRTTLSEGWTNHSDEKPHTLAEAESRVAERPHFVAPYLDLIPFYLDADRLADAENAIQYAKLAYTGKQEDRLLLQWYEAELAAQKGEVAQAARLGDEATHRFMQQGVYGPGTFGQLMYNQLVFRRPAMLMETVPQMEMILLPDAWGGYLYQTAAWYQQAGDTARADALLKEWQEAMPVSQPGQH